VRSPADVALGIAIEPKGIGRLMRTLQTSEVARGLKVIWVGPDWPFAATPKERNEGRILSLGHPGRIRDWAGPGLNHLMVDFVGLAHTLESIDGHDFDEHGRYVHLAVPSEEEWDAACQFGWWSSSATS
jgi:hypothetical protein